MHYKKLLLAAFAALIACSCTKHSDPPTNNPPPNAKPGPFTVTVDYRTETTAALSWSSADSIAKDSVRYTVLLGQIKKDSNLLRQADTLMRILPDSAYLGIIIAVSKHGDSSFATFNLPAFQGYAYVQSGGFFGCVDIIHWKYKWQLPGISYYGSWSSPCFNGDTLFITNGASSVSTLMAINKKDGNIIWQSSTGDDLLAPQLYYDNGRLFFKHDTQIFAFNSSTGAFIWKNQFATYPSQNPIAMADNLVFAGDNDKKIYALDAGDGHLVWSYLTNGPVSFSVPLATKDVLYFGNNTATLYALSPTTGNIIWKITNENGGAVGPHPLRDSTGLYANIGGNTLYRLNPLTGNILWQQYPSGIAAFGALQMDRTTIFTADDAKIYSIDKLTGQINYSTGASYPNYGSFRLANHRMYYLYPPHFVTLDCMTGQEALELSNIDIYNVQSMVMEINGITY